MNQRFCVYEHWLDDVCFYVGKGLTKNRPHSFYDSTRSELWKSYVGNRKDDIQVRVVETFETNIEALRKETELTLYYQKLGMCQANGNRVGCSSIGKANHFYGKHHTEETKMKISESKKNKNIGEQNPFFGKKHSEETKKKIAQKSSKKIRCINLDITFDKLSDCAKYFGIKNYGSIIKAMENNRPYKRQHYFEYVD